MIKTTNTLKKISIKADSCFSTFFLNTTATNWRSYMANYNINYLGVKKIHLKIFLASFLIFLTFYTQVYAAKREYYRFSSDIYDQSKILTRQNLHSLSKDEINKKLKDELLNRKKEELGRTFIKRINESIDILEDEFRETSKGQFRKKIIEILEKPGENASLIGMLMGGSIGGVTGGPIGSLIGAGVGIAAGLVSSLGGAIWKEQLNKKISYSRDPQGIIKKMDELKEKREELIFDLEHEPIGEIEQRYILQKQYMTQDLQTEIERSLLQSRAGDYFFQLNTPAIGYALGLPLGPKPLLDPYNIHKSKLDLIKRFKKDPSFSIYSEEIREHLLNIITQIADNSISASSKSPLKIVEHWFGSGSTGKSTAAKQIARFLGLPYYEKRITNPETEISMTSFSGALRSFQGSAQLGWLAEALLQKVEGDDKKTYQNGCLILDDFPVDTQNGQNFLLAITDPEKRKFTNDYLQTDLESLLNIFIISNGDLKSLKQNPDKSSKAVIPDFRFKALRSRFKTTRFPEFNEGQKKKMATPYLEEDLVNQYKPPFFYEFKYVDPRQIQVTYNSQALASMGLKETECTPRYIPTGVPASRQKSITIREIKRVLRDIINSDLNKLIQSSAEHYEHYQKTQDDKELRFAAVKGHPEAISKLVKEQMNSQTIQEKKETRRWIARGHVKSGNIGEAKKWWEECLKLGGWEVLPEVLKYLPYQIENKQDGRLVDYLLIFSESYNEKHIWAPAIGNYLYLMGLHSTDKHTRAQYLNYSKKLGNQQAIENLFQFKTLERDQTEYYDVGSRTQNIFNPPPLDINDLVEDLKYTSALTSLTISYKNLGNEGMKSLGTAFKHNNSLISINLSFAWITDEGISSLGEALEEKPQLKHLILSDFYAQFSKQSIISLSKKLPGVKIDTCYGEFTGRPEILPNALN